jgi:hypothetical protein
MIRARLAADAPAVAAMKCEAARNGLADLLSGPVPLTEWALLESHLRQCARCRELEARLRQLVAAARQPVAPSQRVLGLARDFTPRAGAGVRWAWALAVGRAGDLRARMGTPLAILREAAPSVAAVDATGRARRTIARVVQRTIRAGRSARTVGTVLALALTVCALPGTDGPRPPALPPAPPSAGLGPARLEAAWIESAQPEPASLQPAEAAPVRQAPSPSAPALLPAPAIETRTEAVGLPRPDSRRHARAPLPPHVSAPSPSDVSVSEPGLGTASSSPAVGAELPVAASHVVGRLTAKNPRAAQRDLISLLADVGGTELARNHRITSTSVEVVVPQSRYGEFADGLARIGSWQLEAARSPLPDAVHMTIQLID